MKMVNVVKACSAGVCLTIASALFSPVVERASNEVGIDLVLVSTAQAQAKERPKTRKLPGISEKVMKRLGVVTELTSPDTEKNPNAKPDFPKALKELASFERYCEKKCNDYEKAQIHRFYAFAYYSTDNYKKAIQAYKTVYSLSPNIPIAVELDALNSLAQLSYAEENYNDALKYLTAWMNLSTIVGADKYFLRGSISYSKGDKKAAKVDVDRAISTLEDKGKVARESWYNLQLALNLEKENYKAAKPILEKLIRNYPKAKWWTQYSNINGLLGSEKNQLASLDAAEVMGGLDKRQDIVNTAYLYLGDDVPYKAAKILEKGMKDGNVERNVKYLKILATAYRAARETDDAIKVMNQAAKAAKKEDAANKGDKKYKAEEGNIYAELTALYGIADKNKEAVSAGKKALAAGSLKRPCEVHTNMGISYVELGQFKSAVNSFSKAKKEKSCRAYVTNWIKFAQNEQKSKEALAK